MFKKHIKSISLILMITIAGKVLGFIRELVMAYFYGTGSIVDSFLMAESLPSIFFGWTTAIATAFVPVYQELKVNNVATANKYTKSVLMIISGLSVVFVSIGLIFAKQIISFGAAGFSEEQKNNTYILYVICTLSYLYYSQIQLLTNYINCNGYFIKSALSTIVISPIQTIFIIISFFSGKPVYMAFGVSTAYLAQLLIVVINVKDIINSDSNTIRVKAKVIQTLKMAIPLFLTTMVTRLNVLIDKMFASGLKEGSISALGYGETLRTVFFSLITAIITSLFYPVFSDAVAKGDTEKSVLIAREFITGSFMVTIPLTVVGITLSRWGTAVIYLRGSFNMDSLSATSTAFSLYMFGLSAMTIRDICNNCMESYKKTISPLYICTLIVIFNVIMDYCFINTIGYAGLPLATSLSNLILVPLEFWILKRAMKSFHIKETVYILIKIAVVSLISVVPILVYVRTVDGIFISAQFGIKVLMLLIAVVIYGGFLLILLLKTNVIRRESFIYVAEKVNSKVKKGR